MPGKSLLYEEDEIKGMKARRKRQTIFGPKNT